MFLSWIPAMGFVMLDASETAWNHKWLLMMTKRGNLVFRQEKKTCVAKTDVFFFWISIVVVYNSLWIRLNWEVMQPFYFNHTLGFSSCVADYHKLSSLKQHPFIKFQFCRWKVGASLTGLCLDFLKIQKQGIK